jgi:hypothetical protein
MAVFANRYYSYSFHLHTFVSRSIDQRKMNKKTIKTNSGSL